MRIKNIYGREVNVNIRKYLIRWDREGRSKLETEVRNFLYPFWKNHVVTSEQYIPGSRLRCDMLNWSRMIATEIDGKQHGSFSKFYHSTRAGYLSSFKRDMKKEQWLEMVGFKLIRIIPEDLSDLSRQWFIEKYGVDII